MDGAGEGSSGGVWEVGGARVCAERSLAADGWDATVLLCCPDVTPPDVFKRQVQDHFQLDKASTKAGAVSVVKCDAAAGGRLVLASTGPLGPYDDVRSWYEAARAGVSRAGAAGAAKVLLALQPHPRFERAELVALLGALEAFYVPLQVRESFSSLAPPLRALGAVDCGSRWPLGALLHDAAALEAGRIVARDIGGADPERMTPAAVATYVQSHFAESPVRVRVIDDNDVISREYPLFAAASRAADAVERHRSRIVFLEYSPESSDKSVFLVGKGVTYDTGGCDLKVNGAMAGMSRDKCGAGAVAGLLAVCAKLRPNIRVTAALALMRNSVGEEGYVADELLKSRGGLSVRIGNTDAEGRLAMADLLHELATRAKRELATCAREERELATSHSHSHVHVYSLATLTGHAVRCYGSAYTAAVDNHCARDHRHAERLRAAAETLGDMVEVSTMRREDLAAHAGRSLGDQLHQADTKPSSLLPRGHQAPAAFLAMVAGLAGADACPYTHLDIAGSAGAPPDPPTAAPLLALAAHLGFITSC